MTNRKIKHNWVFLIIIIIIITATFAIKILNVKSFSPYPASTYVKRVVDGDTFVDRNNKRYRLLGIDTPEMARENRPQEPYALEATNFAKKIIEYQNVNLKYDEEKLDKYNRLLVYVYAPNGQMLNELLLKEGLAEVFRKQDFKYKKKFKQLQNQAKQKKVGMWNQ